MTTRYWLKDQGQDLIYVDVDDRGNVLTYPYKGWLWYDQWSGDSPKKLKRGATLLVSQSPQHDVLRIKYPITKIEVLAELEGKA